MIHAIIFDLDGTLVDAYPGIHQSLNETLLTLNLPEVSLDVVKNRVGRGVINLIQQSVPPSLAERALQLFLSSYDRTHLSGTFLLPDVQRTLQELQRRKVRLAIASNKPAEFTQNILKQLELSEYFPVVAGPEGKIKPKPDPSMLESVMQSLGADRNETLYVGDMALDSETARNAGVRLALIASGGHAKEVLEKEKPDYLLNRFTDLIRIIDAEVGGGGGH